MENTPLVALQLWVYLYLVYFEWGSCPTGKLNYEGSECWNIVFVTEIQKYHFFGQISITKHRPQYALKIFFSCHCGLGGGV